MKRNSYAVILRSTSIVGGGAAFTMLLGFARTKAIAVLLGPTGVGLIGLYQAVVGLLGTIAGLGIQSSGVRFVAEANGIGQLQEVGEVIKCLRRACWATGILGWVLTASLAPFLSQWSFGSPDHVGAIAVLGATILLGTLSGGQFALLQGMRRIGDLARINVASAIAGIVVSLPFYWFLGEGGIVPALVTTAAINLAVSWWFARKISVVDVDLPWDATVKQIRRLVTLGLAFMWSGLLASGVAFATHTMILRELGLEANGMFHAAWGISGVFAGFILSAMGTDFYPRITAVANDHPTLNRLVNEQVEIGALLSLPGLLATLAFAPLLMRLFYSVEFLPGAELLPLFVLGIFGRVVSWPLGYIMIAKGNTQLFATTETVAHLSHLGLIMILLPWFGIVGVAYAFAVFYAGCSVGMLIIARRITSFRWSGDAVSLLAFSAALVVCSFLVQQYFSGVSALLTGFFLTIVSGVICLRGIVHRVGHDHRIVTLLRRVPGFRLISGQ